MNWPVFALSVLAVARALPNSEAMSPAVARASSDAASKLLVPNDLCHCPTTEKCSCCARLVLNDSIFHMNDTACATMQYLPQQEDLDLALVLNGHTILDKKVDIKHLSKECVGIPYIKKAAEICAIFSKVNISTEEVGACIDLDVELLGATVLDANLGCFTLHIPDNTTTALL